MHFDFDFDHYDRDMEHEVWRESTGFLTNFTHHQLPQYQQAIEQYAAINPDVTLTIGEASNALCDHGLYVDMYCDLSHFWDIFRKLDDARRPKYTLRELLKQKLDRMVVPVELQDDAK